MNEGTATAKGRRLRRHNGSGQSAALQDILSTAVEDDAVLSMVTADQRFQDEDCQEGRRDIHRAVDQVPVASIIRLQIGTNNAPRPLAQYSTP